MRYDGFEITVGGRTRDLVRMPSINAIRDVPPEVLTYAQGGYETGRKVSVRATARRWFVGIAVIAVACVPVVVLGVAFPKAPLFLLGGLLAAPAMMFAVIHIDGIRWPLQVRDSAAPTRAAWPGNRRLPNLAVKGVRNLSGRLVCGNNRESVQLWREALAGVGAGTRPAEELPAIHQALLQVADAENQVKYLFDRSGFELDQSAADVARAELGVVVAQARELMGLTSAQIEQQTYLSNRWGQAAGATEPEVFGEELR